MLASPRSQSWWVGSTHLPGARQVKASLTFTHNRSRRKDSMLWLQSLREEIGGKLDLPQPSPKEMGRNSGFRGRDNLYCPR